MTITTTIREDMQQPSTQEIELSREDLFEYVHDIKMNSNSKQILTVFINGAMFEFAIIDRQLMEALDFTKQAVIDGLNELIYIGLVKQQAFFGKERTYILNKKFFLQKRPPKYTQEDLRKMLRIVKK